MDIYTFTTAYIASMELFLVLFLLRILKYSTSEDKSIVKASFIFTIWMIGVWVLFGYFKVLPQNISNTSLFGIVLVGVAFSGIFFYMLKEQFLSLSQEFLLLPQAMRMFFGAGFIVEAAYGIIPINYGVIDGMLHITTAFLSVTLAVYLAKQYRCTKSIILVNIFGLLDIVIVAAGISFVILGEIGSEHNVFLAVFFAAPIFIWLHLISLYKVFNASSN